MRNLVVYELLSLDGVAEQPDAFMTGFDEVMRENLGRVIAAQDAVLLGRRTYDEWASFWPSSDIEPFATFINAVEKFVVTSSPCDAAWSNTTVIDRELPVFVNELKQRPGGDIGVHGSVELAQALLREGLVDQLRLVIAPVIHARGRRLFSDAPARGLALTRSVVSPTGYLLCDYTVTDR
jgi:dihydrofolate reductase